MNLVVRLGGQIAGTLQYDSAANRFSFEYAPAWLAGKERYPLAPDLPLTRDPTQPVDVHSAAVRNFFENLLPEGDALDVAAAATKTSRGNLVGLLVALGREMAGAVSVVPETVDAGGLAETRRQITLQELSEHIRARPRQPFSVWDGKVRLSVAGHQDKVAVLIDGNEWFFVDGAQYASTHLVKPEPVQDQLAGLTSNEYFCLKLADAVRIPVAACDLVHVPEPVLVVRRFDRVPETGSVRRVHVIDGCQALGMPVALKYERYLGSTPDVAHLRDGASFQKFFDMLSKQAPRPLLARIALLRLAIFNTLIGNPDAHAKNYSFFASNSGLALAPAYDLVSHHGFQADLDTTFAFAVGDAFTSADLSAYEWANFANACGLQPGLVARELKQIAGSIQRVMSSVHENAVDRGASREVLDRITAGVARECDRHIEFAAEVPEVDPSLF